MAHPCILGRKLAPWFLLQQKISNKGFHAMQRHFSGMVTDIENMYAERFYNGNKEKVGTLG